MESVFAVITTYSPEVALVVNVARVAGQVGGVVIVDDGATNANFALLTKWFSENPLVTILSMEENSGIAAALNRGIRYAREHGADAVLTLDDDTLIAPGLVSVLAQRLQDWDESAKVGLIAPRWTHRALNPNDEALLAGAMCSQVKMLITSGCLMPMAAFDAVGGFREEFFIDSVDFDLCFRLEDAGYAIVQLDAIGMVHSLGEGASRRICGVSLHSTNHSALRRYYAVRNSLTLARERLFTHPGFALRVLAWWPLTLLKIVLVEDRRRAKLSAIIAGVRDFVARRYGRKSL